MMVVASIAPDVDSLTILAGRAVFYEQHCTLVHSLGGVVGLSVLMATMCVALCLVARAVVARFRPSGKFGRLARALAARRRDGNCLTDFPLIFTVSLLAMVLHLVADAMYPWEMPLLWPFHGAEIEFGILDWGDRMVLVLAIGAMFGLAIFRNRTRRVAWSSMAALALYWGIRAFFPAT